MAVAFAVVSLYFLHVGFRNGSPFCLSLGGIAAGLCLASSISGKQYLLGLVIAAPLYAAFYWKSLRQSTTWSSLVLVVYGFLVAAAPILLYIEFNRDNYTSIRIRLSSRFLAGATISSVSSRNQALHQAALGLLFHYPGSSLLYSGCVAYSAAILLALSARRRASSLAEAF